MNKLLLGTLAVILAAAAEPIAVSYLLEDGDLDAAGVLEDATVISLPVLYVILNAVLFGLPMLKTCYAYHYHDISCGSHAPRSMRKERKFIPCESGSTTSIRGRRI